MSEILVKERDVVVPGEILAKGMDFVPAQGTFRDKEEIISNQLGLVGIDGRLIKVIALNGKYTPKREDTVIGTVVDMTFNSWFVDIGCTNDAVLSLRDTKEFIEKGSDLSQYYSFGDVIVANVANVTRGNIDLSMKDPGLRKLIGGMLIKINPSKVPRVIGKKGSMISMVKDKTQCKITVGQNGVVWIQGEPENELAAVQAIQRIERESYKEGLTDEMTKFLDSKVKGETDVQKKK